MGLNTIPVPLGLTYRRQYFSATTTFTLPTTNINEFDCVIVSGGSGGAKANLTSRRGRGGMGLYTYHSNVFCTAGTTLTITIGAGGAGATVSGNDGAAGNASTITGIAGNGVTTSLTCNGPEGGKHNNNTAVGFSAPQGMMLLGGRSLPATQSTNVSVGPGKFGQQPSLSGNYSYNNANQLLSGSFFAPAPGGSYRQSYFGEGGGAGIFPLLGEYLHATAGSSGTTVASGTGGTSTANTFFAGHGGGSNQTTTGTNGNGGGGGGGGAGSGATTGGAGGNASANSGAGGGGGGKNTSTEGGHGNGGNGGSGFIIIGYWG